MLPRAIRFGEGRISNAGLAVDDHYIYVANRGAVTAYIIEMTERVSEAELLVGLKLFRRLSRRSGRHCGIRRIVNVINKMPCVSWDGRRRPDCNCHVLSLPNGVAVQTGKGDFMFSTDVTALSVPASQPHQQDHPGNYSPWFVPFASNV